MIYLAASTPPGHELHYFEAKREGAESADLYSCDLVAISTFSAQILEAYAVADHLREAGVRVTMGGLHVTVQPGESLQHADYVFLGEGENTWPVAVTAIDHGKAQRVWNATDFPPIEVGLLPVPRYDLLAGHPYSLLPIPCADDAQLPLEVRFLRV